MSRFAFLVLAVLVLPLAAAHGPLPDEDVARDGGLESAVADCATTPTPACQANPDLRHDGNGFRVWFSAGLAPGLGLGGSRAVDLGIAGTPTSWGTHGQVAAYLRSGVALGDLEGTHVHYQTASTAFTALSLYLRVDLTGDGQFGDCLIAAVPIVASGAWEESSTGLDFPWSVGRANGCNPTQATLPLAAIRSAFPNALVRSLHVQTVADGPVAAGNSLLVDGIEVLASQVRGIDPVRIQLTPQNALRTDAATIVHAQGGSYGFEVATEGAQVCAWRAELVGLPHGSQAGADQVILSMGSYAAAGATLDLARPAVSPCSASAFFSIPQGAVLNALGNMGGVLLRYTFVDPDGGEHTGFYSELANDLRAQPVSTHQHLLPSATPVLLARGNVAVVGTLPEEDLTLDQAAANAPGYIAGLPGYVAGIAGNAVAPVQALVQPVLDCAQGGACPPTPADPLLGEAVACVEDGICPEPPVDETALDPVTAELQPLVDCAQGGSCPSTPPTPADPLLACLGGDGGACPDPPATGAAPVDGPLATAFGILLAALQGLLAFAGGI